MNITNEQIIQSARRQRQIVDHRIDIEPWHSQRPQRRGIAAAIAVAASAISFVAGYGFHAKMSHSETHPLVQNVQIQHDTVMRIETVRDTVYQTRIVTKHEKTLMAQSVSPNPTPPPRHQSEQTACSMLCDDIPYDLLATP